MKNLILLITFSFFGFNSVTEDCFDFAVNELNKAEAVIGSMMDDESATNYLNAAYAICWGQNEIA